MQAALVARFIFAVSVTREPQMNPAKPVLGTPYSRLNAERWLEQLEA
jgi:hypothetical protein